MKTLCKTTFMIFASLLWAFITQAQQNMIYGYQGDDEAYFNSLPQMVLTPQSAATALPSEVDNSQQIFFPHENNSTQNLKLYDQTGTGSCIYVSTVYYAYAYEYNRLKGLAGNTPQTRFAPNSLYNYINGGDPAAASDFNVAHPLMQEYGVMSEADWGNLETLDYLRWQSGYDLYHRRHIHRISGAEHIAIGTNPVKIEEMKHYLNDHNEGGISIGGVLNKPGQFRIRLGFVPLPEWFESNICDT